jgi:hypothetical protein
VAVRLLYIVLVAFSPACAQTKGADSECERLRFLATASCHEAEVGLAAARHELERLGPAGGACLQSLIRETDEPTGVTLLLVADLFASSPGLAEVWLSAPHARLRAAALGSIARLGRASPPLIQAVEARLGDAVPRVRAAAESALAAVDARSSAWRIEALLDDPDREVRRRAAYALARLASPAPAGWEEAP